jgi:hypothetical protein
MASDHLSEGIVQLENLKRDLISTTFQFESAWNALLAEDQRVNALLINESINEVEAELRITTLALRYFVVQEMVRDLLFDFNQSAGTAASFYPKNDTSWLVSDPDGNFTRLEYNQTTGVWSHVVRQNLAIVSFVYLACPEGMEEGATYEYNDLSVFEVYTEASFVWNQTGRLLYQQFLDEPLFMVFDRVRLSAVILEIQHTRDRLDAHIDHLNICLIANSISMLLLIFLIDLYLIGKWLRVLYLVASFTMGVLSFIGFDLSFVL